MSDQVKHILESMPPAEEIAVQTISILAAEGYHSSVMRLPRPLLNEIARELVTPGARQDELLEQIQERGHNISRSALNRFALTFLPRYKIQSGKLLFQLMAEERERLHPKEADDQREYNRARIQRLIGLELSAVASPEDIDTKRLRALIYGIRVSDMSEVDQDRLALAKDIAEQRAAKLSIEVEQLRLQLETKRQEIERAGASAKAQAEEKAKASGGTITRDDVIRMIDKVMRGEDL